MFFRFAITLAIVLLGGCKSASDYTSRGWEALEKKNYRDAVLSFGKALQKDGNNARALQGMARAERAQNDYVAAFQHLSSAMDAAPDNDEIKLELAELCVNGLAEVGPRARTLHDRLIAISQSFLRKNPSSFDGLRLRGYVQMADGKTKEAIADLEAADSLQPGDARVTVPLALVKASAGDAAEAEKMLRAAISRQPGQPEPWDALYRMLRANKRDNDAEALLRDKVVRNPNVAAFHTQLAGHLLTLGKTAEANTALAPLASRKDLPLAAMDAGDMLVRFGRASEALEWYRKGEAAGGEHQAAYRLRIARVLESTGKREEAIASAETAWKARPDDEEARSTRALLMLNRGRKEDVQAALDEFRKLAGQSPRNYEYRYQVARAHLALGQNDLAKAAIRSTLELRGDFLPALVEWAEFAREDPRTDLEAIAKRILELDPGNVRASHLLAIAQIRTNRLAEARQTLTRIAQGTPSYAGAQLELARLDALDKQFASSEKRFRDLMTRPAVEREASVGLVSVLLAQGKGKQAEEVVMAGMRKYPASAGLRRLYVEVLQQQGKVAEATAEAEKLLAADPNSADNLMVVGDMKLMSKDAAGAVPVFQKAAATGNAGAREFAALATSLEMAGRGREALAAYEKLLSFEPENPLVMNNVAFLRAEHGGDLQLAMAQAEKALKLAQANPNVRDTIAYIQYKRKSLDVALHTYDSLTQAYPNNATYWLHRGMVQKAKGDAAGARQSFERAQRENKDPSLDSRIRAEAATAR